MKGNLEIFQNFTSKVNVPVAGHASVIKIKLFIDNYDIKQI